MEKDDYKNKIGNVFALPEILFGKNYLKISNKNHNFEISFNALDALNDWKNENLPSFKACNQSINHYKLNLVTFRLT